MWQKFNNITGDTQLRLYGLRGFLVFGTSGFQNAQGGALGALMGFAGLGFWGRSP